MGVFLTVWNLEAKPCGSTGQTSGLPILQLFIDSGTENLNSEVQELEDNDLIKKVVAQIDVHFSNSMIEAFFRKLKHHYLST